MRKPPRQLDQEPKAEAYKLTSPFSLNIPRCRHLKVNGTQCGSPALKDHRFCFFHQQWHERKLIINSARSRKARATITLPVLEDGRLAHPRHPFFASSAINEGCPILRGFRRVGKTNPFWRRSGA